MVRGGVGGGVAIVAVATAPLCALQGCAALAGLEEPTPPEASTSGGGGSGGSGGGSCAPGTHVVPLATGQKSPRAIVVDDKSVYWTTEGAGNGDNGIWKLDLPMGSPLQLAQTDTRNPIALAVDGTHVFWSDTKGGKCSGDQDHDRILRIAHDGKADPTSFDVIDTFCSKAQTIALGAQDVYWARPTSNYIQSKPKTPNTANPSTVVYDAARAPFGLALDSSFLYWTDQAKPNAKVARTLLGGSTEDLSGSDGTPTWIVVEDHFVYWTTDTKLLKHDKNTLDEAPTELHTGLQSAGGLAVDGEGEGDSVYVTSAGDLLKIPKDGSSSTTPIVETSDLLGGVAVDGTFVYWTDTTTGEILRACK